MIRVAHFPGSLSLGGVGSVVMNIYRKIDRKEIQFDFYVSRSEEGPFDKEVRQMGGRVISVPKMRDVGLLNYVKIVSNMLKMNGPYDYVHVHSVHTGVMSILAAKKAGINGRIFHSHSAADAATENYRFSNLLNWGLSQIVKRSSTRLLACGKDAGRYAFGEQPFTVVNNGIDLEKYTMVSQAERNQIRKELGVPDSRTVVGHVGRFVEGKNQRFLIDLADMDAKRNGSLYFIFVGDGDLLTEAKQYATRLRLNNVLFMGSRQDVGKLYNAFDVFCLPSLFEGLPVTLIEAQAYGIPCISSVQVTNEADLSCSPYWQLPIDRHEEWLSAIDQLAHTARPSRELIEKAFYTKHYDIMSTVNDLTNIYKCSRK